MLKIFLIANICLFFGSCSSAIINPGNQHDSVQNAIFTRPDGKDIVFFVIAPDGQKTKIVVPNGQRLIDATLWSEETHEKLKINVNFWLNKLLKSNSNQYVDNKLEIYPVVDGLGHFCMTDSDMKTVNNILKSRGYKYQLLSTERGLGISR